MANTRETISDENLEKIVGGLFEWYPKYNTMKYTHSNGSVTKHTVLNYDKAWEMSNNLHGKNIPEDDILAQLISAGYIQG